MDPRPTPPHLVGTQRLGFEPEISDDGDRLRVSPRLPGRAIFVGLGIITILFEIIGVKFFWDFGSIAGIPPLLVWAVIGLGPSLVPFVGLVWITRTEIRRGPILVLDRTPAVVVLPRLAAQYDWANVAGLRAVTGPWSVQGETEQATELSLLVVSASPTPEAIPFLMRPAGDRMDALGEQLAQALECPLHRESLDAQASPAGGEPPS